MRGNIPNVVSYEPTWLLEGLQGPRGRGFRVYGGVGLQGLGFRVGLQGLGFRRLAVGFDS